MASACDSGSDVGLWSAFWRDSTVDGCVAAFPDAARRAIADRWRKLFTGVAADARLLDLCSGRGAVLAQAAAAGLTQLTGIDTAATPPGVFAIQAGVDAAALPFADRSFAIVTSQFGIEYAGLAMAGAEAARVCDGGLWLLLHAAEGPVVMQGRTQIAQIEWLADGIDAFGRLRRHMARRDAATAADVEALRAAIVVAAETADNTALLEAVWQAVPAIVGTPMTLAAVDRFADDLAGHARRLAAMVAAAPSRAATEKLGAELRSAGFGVEIEDLVADAGSGPVARWVIARRL